MLDVGSGKYAGYTVYYITSDQPPTYGCTSKPINLFGMPIACTGPSNSQKAEWPAVTTKGAPIAGPGVSQKLLGTVQRAGVGEQVTYAGHPSTYSRPQTIQSLERAGMSPASHLGMASGTSYRLAAARWPGPARSPR